MGEAATIHRRDATWTWAALLAIAIHLVWFGFDWILGGFRNLDVAGIAYNARLLLDGALPYVDSWEPKPPGTFFLFAAILAFGSMHAVWGVAILWGAATSLAVGLLAGRLWGRRMVLPAVALHAGSTLLPTQADINYVFWATLPFVLAAAMACKPGDSIPRPRLHWFLVGAVAAVAVLFKQSMVGLLAVLALGVFFHAGPGLRPKLQATLFGTLGAAAIFAALFLPWVLAGETRALIAGLGLEGGWWVDYSASQAEVMGGVGAALFKGTGYIANVIQIGSAAAVLGLAGLPRQGRERKAWLFAVIFLIASYVGMAVTLRFYLHYLAQILPALVVVALRPAGLFVRLVEWLQRWGARPALVCLLLAVFGTWLRIDKVERLRVNRADSDRVVANLCAAVGPLLGEDDPVLAWGWASWGIYEHCGRRAPGPIYKAMTIVTTPNTNTGYRKSETMVFRPGVGADRFAADFVQAPPAIFLWSHFYARDGVEPLVDLPPIVESLTADYAGFQLERNYVAFVRRDLHERLEAAGIWVGEPVTWSETLEKWIPSVTDGGVTRAD